MRTITTLLPLMTILALPICAPAAEVVEARCAWLVPGVGVSHQEVSAVGRTREEALGHLRQAMGEQAWRLDSRQCDRFPAKGDIVAITGQEPEVVAYPAKTKDTN